MSAIYGTGQEEDITYSVGDELATTTSQYKCVFISAANTVNIPTATASAWSAIGINQTYLSAGADFCRVRVHGISKAYCGASVAAGVPVQCIDAAGISTTTWGMIEPAVATWATSVTVATVGNFRTILGIAQEAGSTNTVISVMLDKSIVSARAT